MDESWGLEIEIRSPGVLSDALYSFPPTGVISDPFGMICEQFGMVLDPPGPKIKTFRFLSAPRAR